MKTNSYFLTGADMLSRILPPLNFGTFVLYMSVLLDLAREMSDEEERKYERRGYLTLMNGINGEIIFTIPFGEIPEDKRERYFKNSQEKANRLFSQINASSFLNGHTSSYQSRNPDEQKYGGAIHLNGHSTSIILSFSGMPELIDEAMMLVLANKLVKDIELRNVRKIEACGRNPYWEHLQGKFMEHPSIVLKVLKK